MTDRAIAAALAAAEQALARGDTRGADRAFAAARRRVPDDATLALAHANVFRAAGEVPRARALLVDALDSVDWTDAESAHALGTALLETGAARAAVRCFERVTAARPRDPAGHAALAGALRSAGRPGDAWHAVERALTLDRTLPAALLTAAQVRHDLGDAAGARRFFDRAERARPDHAPTRLQRAYVELADGASAARWALLDARSQPTGADGSRPWHGEPLDGGSIVVLAEQGVGDQFQFLRFVRRLRAAGAGRVVVEAHPAAVSLLRAAGYDAMPRGEAPAADWYVPLLSLPHRLGVDTDVDGSTVPYISVDAPAIAARPTTATRDRRLGLVWAGNPAFPGRETRDFDAGLLSRLAEIAGVAWVPLQQGDAAAAGEELFGPAPVFADWLATARTLRSLDGLVTTDTGIAHLAGAMGVRTWVLLQHAPDWRWGRAGETTPWYPTHRLVRQPAPRDWEAVVEMLESDLRAGGSAA